MENKKRTDSLPELRWERLQEKWEKDSSKEKCQRRDKGEDSAVFLL